MKFGLVGFNEHSLPFVNTPFSPKSPLSEGPLCHLIWIFVYNLAILAIVAISAIFAKYAIFAKIAKGEADPYKSSSVPGFYLGYLRCRSFPPKMPSFPQKILFLLQYRSHYIGKSSRRDEVSAHKVSNPCLRTQLCLKMHQIASQRISIWKTELEDWARGLRPLGTSSPNEKS